MCGICGIYNYNLDTPVESDLLKKMADVMSHRGPDDQGIFIDRNIGLGHSRLSIIDVTGGHQPLSNEDGSIWLVSNSEIYNFHELKIELQKKGHVFKTKTDTEVVVHAYEEYGKECVTKFNGMFAFAIWNKNEERLFLARDRLGIKPLYYYFNGHKFIFASEIKSILQERSINREPDIEALDLLLTYRYVPSPYTMLKNIKKLLPGHIIDINTNGINIRKFWAPIPQIVSNQKEEYYIERIQELLQNSVKKRLTSDVPLGALLSGGVDSASIVAIMSELTSKPVKTFTIGFEGGQKTNELKDAKATAKLFNTEHYEISIGPNDYMEFFPKYIWYLEEPIDNTSAIAWYYVSKLAQEHVKVVLTGQGADEPFAGYHRYKGEKLSQFYRRIPSFITDGVFRPFIERMPRNERIKRAVHSLGEPNTLKRFLQIYAVFSDEMKSQLYKDRTKSYLSGSNVGNAISSLQNEVKHIDSLAQMMYIDTRVWLPDDLLTVGDKLSMATSLEVRLPFLDHELVEFVETIPSNLKLKGLTGKYIHKKAMQKWLPREIVYRKKKGFVNPVDEWLRDKMVFFVNDLLLAKKSACQEYFHSDYIKLMLRKHKERKEGFQRQIFLLISFEMWYQQFINNKC